MIRALLNLLVWMGIFFAAPAWAEPVVLTVSGEITETNRGPINEFDDVLFSKLEVSFDSAYEFTSGDLKALPQVTITARYPNWPSEVTVTGPTLQSILAKVGATGGTVSVRAVDGYAPEFNLSEIDTSQFILAIKANDKPLGIGGRGPLWLVFPQDSYKGQPEDDNGLTWAAIHIEVK